MTLADLEAHVRNLGHEICRSQTATGDEYLVIAGIGIHRGPHAGRICDVAIQLLPGPSFMMPAAIQVRPALLPMQGGEPFGTQASPLGPDWQYWSRRFDGVPTPSNIWARIARALEEERG